MDIEENIIIKAPVESVFAYMLEVQNRVDYIPMLEKVEVLDPPPIQLGSRYVEVATIAGQDLRTTYQVIGFEENKFIQVKTTKSVFPIQVDLNLIPEGTQTTVLIQMKLGLSGAYRLAGKLIRGIVKQQAKDILQRLKENIERLPA